MILTDSDRTKYFPDVTLTGDALDGAILRAQAIAQSPRGANRVLEVRPYVLRRPVFGGGKVFLSYWPIVTVHLVEGRLTSSSSDSWGRPYYPTDWETIPVGEYELDPVLAELRLKVPRYTEVRCSFTAGFTFTGTLTPEAETIKTSVGQILDYLNTAVGQGVKKLGTNDLEFQAVEPMTVPDDLLAPLRPFRPRGV